CLDPGRSLRDEVGNPFKNGGPGKHKMLIRGIGLVTRLIEAKEVHFACFASKKKATDGGWSPRIPRREPYRSHVQYRSRSPETQQARFIKYRPVRDGTRIYTESPSPLPSG